ncbi:MAG: hypothetical protein Q4F13_04575 [Pseudomonadota bacterium]|nr:hypothetical protein [Pseudomonadota bacterium]
MPERELTLRERFRQHGRQVLRVPGDAAAHEARIMLACELQGAEPLQGALADMLHACPPNAEHVRRLLRRPAVAQRLAPFVARALLQAADSGQRLPRATALATRYSVLAMPSLDVPRRALLVGVDDSRGIAARATAALLAGQPGAEDEFLTHCEGAGDTLAFMLVRRALAREGKVLSERWSQVAQGLQQSVPTGEQSGVRK